MVFHPSYAPVQEPQCNVVDFIFQNRLNIPDDRPLLIDVVSRKQLTFADIKDGILRFAAGLQDKCGFQKGDNYDYTIALLAAPAVGGASSPANPTYTVRELVYQLEQTSAKVLIAHPENIDRALEAAAQVKLPKQNIFIFGDQPVKGIQPFKTALMGTRRAEICRMSPAESKDVTAYLCFSSGTTGRSKGVMTTHNNIAVNILQYYAIDGKFLTANDRTLLTLPMFHIFALTNILHVSLYTGTPVYVMQRFDLALYCKSIQEYKITFVYMVPPILLAIAKDPTALEYDLSSLVWVLCAAAPLGLDLLKVAKERIPGSVIKQGYGLTECSPVVIIEPSDAAHPGSIGFLGPNMAVRLVDENGKDVGLNERGELWVKGPNVMKGYINNPKATAETIDEDGWLHTGDILTRDEEGRYYIVDRLKELIKYKGFQVAPAELESLLLQSPEVADCAVIGYYEEKEATEVPMAFVTLMPNVPRNEETSARLKKHVACQVVNYKQIRKVEFIDAIPKNPSGKILRRVLRDLAKEDMSKPARAML
ncbi:hypothetical protein BCR43DRAFT_477892 [Syncephalastrum racemosum]|uniref:Uncharacterized protein n=1 Tax=Syncephalastrum racemosum TaxID=13706 RepID=A0A1X2H4U5_SYNRA|nr:hypothetical protein BCR43DRAFT_477892 [Syncephalastrum racemosum]